MIALFLMAALAADTPDAAPASSSVELSPAEYSAVFTYRDLKSKDAKAESKARAAAQKASKLAKKASDAAIEKADKIGDDIPAAVQSALRAKLTSLPIGARLETITVDGSNPHMVIGINWHTSDKAEVDEDAATIAAVVKEIAWPVGTLVLWASEGERKVYSAKIGHDALQNFSLGKVSEYAKSRYAKLFENVRRGEAAEAD